MVLEQDILKNKFKFKMNKKNWVIKKMNRVESCKKGRKS